MTNQQIELVRSEIARMDARGGQHGRDTLIRQIDAMKKHLVPYTLNAPQAEFIRELEKPGMTEINFEGGRGVGKTTMEAVLMDKIIVNLQRSQTLLVAATYQKFLSDEIPSLQLSLERLGYFEGLHYVLGRDFPASWNVLRAYQQPKTLDHSIKFWNGTIFRIVSLDVSATARGLNADAQIKTEAATLNNGKLEANIGPAVRGSHDVAFQGKKYYGLDANLSSTPLTAEGRWFIEREKAYLAEQEDIKKNRHLKQTKAFVKGTTIHNLHNLMHGYLHRAFEKAQNMTVFKAEYYNERPPVVQDAFYALLDEKTHAYVPERTSAHITEGVFTDCRNDVDHRPDLPLIIGVDFGSRQNCAVVMQYNSLTNEMAVINEFFALGSENEQQNELAVKIEKYYGTRSNRDIYMYYDHYGNIKWGNDRRPLAMQLQDKFDELNWNVQLLTRGASNPFQNLKYRLWQMIMAEDKYPEYPRFRINKDRAHNCFVSMGLTQTEEKRDGSIGKSKKVERSKTVKEEYKTDITDALDCPIFDMFSYLLNGVGASGAGDAYGVGA